MDINQLWQDNDSKTISDTALAATDVVHAQTLPMTSEKMLSSAAMLGSCPSEVRSSVNPDVVSLHKSETEGVGVGSKSELQNQSSSRTHPVRNVDELKQTSDDQPRNSSLHGVLTCPFTRQSIYWSCRSLSAWSHFELWARRRQKRCLWKPSRPWHWRSWVSKWSLLEKLIETNRFRWCSRITSRGWTGSWDTTKGAPNLLTRSSSAMWSFVWMPIWSPACSLKLRPRAKARPRRWLHQWRWHSLWTRPQPRPRPRLQISRRAIGKRSSRWCPSMREWSTWRRSWRMSGWRIVKWATAWHSWKCTCKRWSNTFRSWRSSPRCEWGSVGVGKLCCFGEHWCWDGISFLQKGFVMLSSKRWAMKSMMFSRNFLSIGQKDWIY